MNDLQTMLKRFQDNLDILREREAKYAGSAPVDLLNQIADHQEAIRLVRQAMSGTISRAEMEEALRPLLVDIRDRTEQHPEWGVSIGDVSGGIVNSIIAGRDVNVTNISTGGGAYIGGGVNTGGGEFTGRDKNVLLGERAVYIGGNVQGSTIVTGDENRLGAGEPAFAPVYRAIENASLPAQDKADLTAEVQEIEAEVAKGDGVDESFLGRRLRSLRRISPEIARMVEAALSARRR